MPQCYFYATESDFEPVLRFVFDELNCRVFETYSKPEKELREFNSFEAVANSWRLGDSSISPKWSQLSLWPVAASTMVKINRIALNASADMGTHRFYVQGWGLISLHLSGVTDAGLGPTRTDHSSEKRAMKWATVNPEMGEPAAWDWDLVTLTSAKLNRRIRSLAVAKRESRPVLPAAHSLFATGTPCLLN